MKGRCITKVRPPGLVLSMTVFWCRGVACLLEGWALSREHGDALRPAKGLEQIL